MAHEVTLTLQNTGREIDVWDRYDVTQNILQPGSPWTFSFWHSRAARSTWSVLKSEVKIGATAQLAIDGAPQLTGKIERRKITCNRSGTMMTISGRDLAGVAISWDADPRVNLRNTTLADAIQALVGPFGIPVSIGVSATAVREAQSNVRPGLRSPSRTARRNLLDRVHPKPGEKAWTLIDQICRKLGFMAWVAPGPSGDLALIIDAPRSTGPADYRFVRRFNEDGSLTNDSNIEDSESDIQIQTVPTHVHVLSNAARGDNLAARSEVTVGNEFTTLHRAVASPLAEQPVYIRSSRARGRDNGMREAERVIARANADFEVYECKVKGHSQRSPSAANADILYAVNSVARVADEQSDVDQDMLIYQVSFNGSRQDGQTTTLRMAPLGAIKVVPQAA